MIPIRIPGSLGKHNADLRIIATIGELGYTQSEILKAGCWRPGGIMYIWPETISVNFEIVGRVNSKISGKIKDLRISEEYFRKNPKISKKTPET